MHQVTAYQCNHCLRVYSSQRKARRHEVGCCLDSVNRACATCVHLSKEDEDYDVYLGDGVVDTLCRKVWWCSAKKDFLNKLQRKCEVWVGLPTGGANSYFVQQTNGSGSLNV